MDTIAISPKYQVVIPQAVREALKLSPGEKMRALQFGNRVELIRECGEQAALLQVAGAVHVGKVVPVNAARYALPMADSLIYATAQRQGAIVWTQDANCKGLPGVNCFAKAAARGCKK